MSTLQELKQGDRVRVTFEAVYDRASAGHVTFKLDGKYDLSLTQGELNYCDVRTLPAVRQGR